MDQSEFIKLMNASNQDALAYLQRMDQFRMNAMVAVLQGKDPSFVLEQLTQLPEETEQQEAPPIEESHGP